MNDPTRLSPAEFLTVSCLVGLIFAEILFAYRARSWVSVYKPTIFVAVILFYYSVVSPLSAVFSEGVVATRLVNHRPDLIWGWSGALVFYLSLLVGFYFFSKRLPSPKKIVSKSCLPKLFKVGQNLCIVGFVAYSLTLGFRVFHLFNPFGLNDLALDNSRFIDLGSLTNYFRYSINLLIPGICIMFSCWLRGFGNSKSLLLWIAISSALFLSEGFRFRLVFLFVPIMVLWWFSSRRRPMLIFLSLFLVLFVSFNSVIGQTRTYGQGLNLSLLEGKGAAELLGDRGLGETSVFPVTSGVMSLVSETHEYEGLRPFLAILTYPIPQAWFPGKFDDAYHVKPLEKLYGVHVGGAAFLNYAEYYLIAGWPSLIAMSVFLGWLLRRLWNWFLWRQDEPFAQVIYLLTATYLYMVISRGYLPQVVMLFMFTVAPLWWLYGRWAQPVSRLESSTPLPRG